MKNKRIWRFEEVTAEVEVPTAILEKILLRKRVRIEWITCRVYERVVVKQCFRCLCFGHLNKDCVRKLPIKCLNCVQEGNNSRRCNNPFFCISCRKEGRRLNHSKCPEYRKELQRIREKLVQKFATTTHATRTHKDTAKKTAKEHNHAVHQK